MEVWPELAAQPPQSAAGRVAPNWIFTSSGLLFSRSSFSSYSGSPLIFHVEEVQTSLHPDKTQPILHASRGCPLIFLFWHIMHRWCDDDDQKCQHCKHYWVRHQHTNNMNIDNKQQGIEKVEKIMGMGTILKAEEGLCRWYISGPALCPHRHRGFIVWSCSSGASEAWSRGGGGEVYYSSEV